jgi:hypothetical protein
MKLWTIKITEKGLGTFLNLAEAIQNVVASEIAKQSQIIADDIRKRYFRSSFGMYSEGSELQKGIVGQPVSSSGGVVSGGVKLGDEKTSKFIPKVGETKITISPKKAKALAIPTTKAAYEMGKRVRSLRSIQSLHRVHGGLDTNQKLSKGTLPMFVFRMSAIDIRPRIHPEEVVTHYAPLVTVALRNAVFNALKGI